jgi:phytanoyl-CoA hydroxylase
MPDAATPSGTAGYRTLCADLAGHIRTEGYGVLTNALTRGEIDTLNAEAARMCRIQLRADTGSDEALPDIDVMRKFLCLHQPHKASSVLAGALRHSAIVEVLTRLIGPNVKAMQSMLFLKPEGKPGQAWHQDEHFIPTRDRSLTAAWIALDDATVENGCLWVLPGSHRRGVLYRDRAHDDPRFDCSIEAYGFPYRDSDAVPVEVPAGAVVFFNGYLLHRSLPNTARHGFRRTLVFHYMSAESLLPWGSLPPGTHVGKFDYRDIIMVAGNDPYSWRGIDDIATMHARADRDGGCGR